MHHTVVVVNGNPDFRMFLSKNQVNQFGESQLKCCQPFTQNRGSFKSIIILCTYIAASLENLKSVLQTLIKPNSTPEKWLTDRYTSLNPSGYK